MSRISQIKCDAPNCNTVKQQTNHWWVIRETGTELYFSCQPMASAEDEHGDQHICSTPCMHAMLEQWMQSHMEKPAAPVSTEENMYERSARLYPDGVDHKGDAVWPFCGRR